MSTTRLRLSDDIKRRVGAAAERAGMSAHAFILQAISREIEEQERRSAFQQLALDRFKDVSASGESIPWQAMRGYLLRRAKGEDAESPEAHRSGT